MNKNEVENPPPVPPRRKKYRSFIQKPLNSTDTEIHPHHQNSNKYPRPVSLLSSTKSPISHVQQMPNVEESKSDNTTRVSTPKSRSSATIPMNLNSQLTSTCAQVNDNNDECTPNKLDSNSNQICRKSGINKEGQKKKYPPLFFTLHDFENVMAYSNLQKKESITESINSFVNSFDEDDNSLFRVTTTNSPFEKSMESWSFSIGSGFSSLDLPDQFVFDDYTDRSKRFNRQNASLSFEEDAESLKSASKVRFVIESPSDSTPDLSYLDEDREILNIVTNATSSLDVENEDWWISGRRSPLKIEEIVESSAERLPRNPSVNTLASQALDDEVVKANASMANEVMHESPSNDIVKLESKPLKRLDSSENLPTNVDQVLQQPSRNSFLVNMLSENVNEAKTCSIIAAHPKLKTSEFSSIQAQFTRSTLEKINEPMTDGVSDNTTYCKIDKAPILRPKTAPKPLAKVKYCDVGKSQVLNELLSNFDDIKLKAIVPNSSMNSCGIIAETDDTNVVEKSLANSACSVDKKTDNRIMSYDKCGVREKLANNDNDDDDDDKKNAMNYERNNKCAIVRCNKRNNNDNNNAMTPVAVSYDQAYRDKLSIAITPGRVRSFVKNYEIKVDNNKSKYSKINGNKVDNWSVNKNNNKNYYSTGNEQKRNNDCRTSEEMGYTVILRQNQQEKSNKLLDVGDDDTAYSRPVSPCLKTLGISSPRSGEKKSVKFNSGYTVIHVDNSEGGRAGDKPKVKRRAPVQPVKGERVDDDLGCGGVEGGGERAREAASRVSGETPRVQTTGNENSTASGTSTLAKTTQPYFLKPPYVFYLKV